MGNQCAYSDALMTVATIVNLWCPCRSLLTLAWRLVWQVVPRRTVTNTAYDHDSQDLNSGISDFLICSTYRAFMVAISSHHV